MSVNWQRRAAQTEQQHAGCRFRADSGEAKKPLLCLIQGQCCQMIEIVCAALFANSRQDRLDSRRFRVCESAASDRVGNLLNRCMTNFCPIGKRCLETGKGPRGVDVRCVLGEDGGDEFVEWLVMLPPRSMAVCLCQDDEDAIDLLVAVGQGRGRWTHCRSVRAALAN